MSDRGASPLDWRAIKNQPVVDEFHKFLLEVEQAKKDQQEWFDWRIKKKYVSPKNRKKINWNTRKNG